MAFNLNLLGIAFQLHIISFFFGGLSKCENYALRIQEYTQMCAWLVFHVECHKFRRAHSHHVIYTLIEGYIVAI